LAFFIVLLACGWLVVVALLMALKPGLCFRLFARMSAALEASNWRVHLVEQGLRIVVGGAFIAHAPASKLPIAFEVAGWILVLTSVLILLAPIRWHGKFGTFWVERLTPAIVRACAPLPALAGAGVIYAAI